MSSLTSKFVETKSAIMPPSSDDVELILKKYYRTLHLTPTNLMDYYDFKWSRVGRVGEDGEMHYISTKNDMFEMLTHLTSGYLKLDGSFTCSMEEDGANKTICINVTGFMLVGELRNKFHQTFILSQKRDAISFSHANSFFRKDVMWFETEKPGPGFWDYENCSIPKGVDPEMIMVNINKVLMKKGFQIEKITGIGDIDVFSKKNNNHTLTVLTEKDSGFEIIDLLEEAKRNKNKKGKRKKNAADKLLLNAIWEFANARLEVGGNMLIITGDKGFLPTIKKLKKLGFTIILAYNKLAKKELIESTEHAFAWEKLVCGFE